MNLENKLLIGLNRSIDMYSDRFPLGVRRKLSNVYWLAHDQTLEKVGLNRNVLGSYKNELALSMANPMEWSSIEFTSFANFR